MLYGIFVGVELLGLFFGWNLWVIGGYKFDVFFDFYEGVDDGIFVVLFVFNGLWVFLIGILKYFIYNDFDWSYVGYDFFDFGRKVVWVVFILNVDNLDFLKFRVWGGKLIIDNGWMDGSMFVYDIIGYYE